MSDLRDEAFRRLCDVVRRFNRAPSLTRRDEVVRAAYELISAYDNAEAELAAHNPSPTH